jgi:hypothetical protein
MSKLKLSRRAVIVLAAVGVIARPAQANAQPRAAECAADLMGAS